VLVWQRPVAAAAVHAGLFVIATADFVSELHITNFRHYFFRGNFLWGLVIHSGYFWLIFVEGICLLKIVQ
jgi:hypothetical protein